MMSIGPFRRGALQRHVFSRGSRGRRAGFLRCLGIGALALCMGAFGASEALADEVGFFEAMRLESEARKALEAGRFAEAQEHDTRLIEGLEEGKDRRARAIYRSALAALAKDPADLTVAVEMLDRLPSSFETEDRALEARVLRGLLARMGSVVAAEREAEAALADLRSKRPQVKAQAASAAERADQLEAENARLAAELKAAREELERKEEALAKLREVVVGGG